MPIVSIRANRLISVWCWQKPSNYAEVWQIAEPSYLRHYLDNGQWGKDSLWDALARNAFNLFLTLI